MEIEDQLLHLPKEKIVQLSKAKDLILKKIGVVSKIILYGSYANGNWVQDKKSFDGLEYEYASDFDVLVVVPYLQEKEYVLEDKIVNGWKFPTFLAPDVRDLGYINFELENGNFFFEEVLREGIVLFDDGQSTFKSYKETSNGKGKFAKKYFEKCMKNAEEFESASKNALLNSNISIATFMLHQAAESYYSAILLVFSGYKPKVHNLKLLRERAKEYSEQLYFIFKPHAQNPEETRLFSLLKRGYVEARYHAEFEIKTEEVVELAARINKMRSIVNDICLPRIQGFNIE